MRKKELKQRLTELEAKIETYEKLIITYGEDYQRWFKILLEYFDLVIDFSEEEPKLVKRIKNGSTKG